MLVVFISSLLNNKNFIYSLGCQSTSPTMILGGNSPCSRSQPSISKINSCINKINSPCGCDNDFPAFLNNFTIRKKPPVKIEPETKELACCKVVPIKSDCNCVKVTKTGKDSCEKTKTITKYDVETVTQSQEPVETATIKLKEDELGIDDGLLTKNSKKIDKKSSADSSKSSSSLNKQSKTTNPPPSKKKIESTSSSSSSEEEILKKDTKQKKVIKK